MNEQNVNFQIRAIELLESILKPLTKKLPENPVFQYDINIEHRLNIPQELVVVICSVSVFSESKEELFGSLKTSCIFSVEGLERFFDKGKNALNLPKELLETLNSISISTSRGMMFSSFRGTFLHNAVLPLIDPAGMEK